jgi:hypothetical protein
MFRNTQAWFAHKALTPWKTTISFLFKIIWLYLNESRCNLLVYNTVQSWKVQLSSLWLYKLGKDRQLNKSFGKLMKWQLYTREKHTQIYCTSHGRMNKLMYLFRCILCDLFTSPACWRLAWICVWNTILLQKHVTHYTVLQSSNACTDNVQRVSQTKINIRL